jgi:hypothetical protein
MRVNYTLPGLMPMEPSPAEVSRTGDSPFRARIGIAPAPRFLNWRSLLRLEQVPVNAAVIGPPPRPAELDSTDAATMRVNWRRMLDRQVESFAASADPSRPDTQAIERMLSLLMRFRDDEDDVTARRLAESEG